ncbi:MAG: hypothetical protein ACI9A7_002106 [Cyclobacteriaceae bacterium]
MKRTNLAHYLGQQLSSMLRHNNIALWVLFFVFFSCNEENITLQKDLKFFNPNAEAIILLDEKENVLAQIMSRDTATISLNSSYSNVFIAKYANCQKEIVDQFFISDIIILLPNFVTCRNFNLSDPDDISSSEKSIYKSLLDIITQKEEGFILSQNTTEVVQIGNIDNKSQLALEIDGNFTFDSIALADYKIVNALDRHISLASLNNIELISKSEINCFLSKSVACEYIENINCVHSKAFIQVSKIGFSQNQAIVTYRNQCCRGFAIFQNVEGKYQYSYHLDLC